MDAQLVAALTDLAAEQHGVVSIEQLRRLGVTARQQRRAVADGWLRAAVAGVVVLAGAPPTWRHQLTIGLFALGNEAWVSHEAAARLHRLDRSIERAEFTVPRSRRGGRAGLAVHTTDTVGRLDVVVVDGFRCSSATRTIIDLAASGIADVRLEAAIDSAVRLGLSAPSAIARQLGERRGRRGVRALDRLLVDAGGESRLERLFLELVRRAGVPRPATQRVIRRNGHHVARVDFLFPEDVVVEVTGQLGHSSPSERRRDAHRRSELIELGFRVYEYTWHHVRHEPEYVIDTLRLRLAQVARDDRIRSFRATSGQRCRPHPG